MENSERAMINNIFPATANLHETPNMCFKTFPRLDIDVRVNAIKEVFEMTKLVMIVQKMEAGKHLFRQLITNCFSIN